ncbi:hypothetical protein [Ralstonia solanacearum]|uniref:Lipoprotein n=1 Tax=Ralstonia solanacearum TaxID=305 RepID=A0AAD0S6V0_RALSL|nr:hypothetical protein [Ralstonia solanacearum]AXV81372.1 hypothetical protein CJO77_07260 [Ralstonia solanacearum]AXW52508.1 hypothetical protein CJO92_07260 [Ralstonia solanacearum]
MKRALYAPSLVLLVLLGACASPSQQQSADPANVTNTENGWLALRGKYMDCVQRRADDGVPGNAQTKAVVSSALEACESELSAMHDAFRDYLDAQMVSAHGKAGARQAADRVTHDARDKARAYLMRYVERERYLAKSH